MVTTHLINFIDLHLKLFSSGDPNPNIDQDMGDSGKKELTDEEMEKSLNTLERMAQR